MITSLKLIHFRNFNETVFDFTGEKNFIIWNNGQGKTNILEALALLWGNSIQNLWFEEMIAFWSNYFFIECCYDNGETRAISYDVKTNKKQYLLNKKPTTRQRYIAQSHSCCIFSPMIMNIMYLSPSLRRDFIDTILCSSYPEYGTLLRSYKTIVTSRNKLLQAVAEKKAQSSEIDFWDDKLTASAKSIYSYRNELMRFFQKNIGEAALYFWWKIKNISITYESKLDASDFSGSLKQYLKENRERDIIIGKTARGPHVDDFNIIIDDTLSLTHFASRWETKSVMLWLKLLETVFIEKKQGKKPILIIDDLLSELDTIHKDLFTEKIKYYQTIISSIEEREMHWNIIKI